MNKIKIEKVEVCNLTDLAKIVSYNADTLARLFKRISKNGRRITVLTGIVIGAAILSAYQRHKIEEQVYNLSIRVKKLEHHEGE